MVVHHVLLQDPRILPQMPEVLLPRLAVFYPWSFWKFLSFLSSGLRRLAPQAIFYPPSSSGLPVVDPGQFLSFQRLKPLRNSRVPRE